MMSRMIEAKMLFHIDQADAEVLGIDETVAVRTLMTYHK